MDFLGHIYHHRYIDPCAWENRSDSITISDTLGNRLGEASIDEMVDGGEPMGWVESDDRMFLVGDLCEGGHD
jgi:hypothetical protein